MSGGGCLAACDIGLGCCRGRGKAVPCRPARQSTRPPTELSAKSASDFHCLSAFCRLGYIGQVISVLREAATGSQHNNPGAALAHVLDEIRTKHIDNGFAAMTVMVWSEALRSPAKPCARRPTGGSAPRNGCRLRRTRGRYSPAQ